jgi:hypothetical protein
MKLVEGKGSPDKGACWMSALHYYTSDDALANWSDQPGCVCETIRQFAITLNDMCDSDEERERLIGPHLFAPVGTAGVSTKVKSARVRKIALAAVRVFAPIALDAAGLTAEAARLRALPDDASYDELRDAARAAQDAADAARAARDAAAYAAAAATASRSAAYHAADAADAAADANNAAAKQALLDLILDLCEMGRVEVSAARTREQVLAALETGRF